jgi:pimeloyl-ACP methyl ester carboxylesterase
MNGRSTIILLAAALTGAVLTAVTPAAAATQPDNVTTGGFHPRPINWQPCPERPNDTTIRCGTLQVPIDWSKPHGATFGLAVARQAAADPSQDRGPLLINPGGPGGSGVDFALAASSYFSQDILDHFDVIGFDPRGVDRSHPIECSADLAARQPDPPVPTTQAQYDALLALNKARGEDCRAHTGPLFDHVDTLSVVHDVDAIRAALNARQISYYGVSYGTLIGQEYAEQFPRRIRAMVIDSNMDHSLGTQQFLLTEAATDEDSFDQFVAWCDRDTTCALHGRNVDALWDDLMRRADAGTLTDPTSGAPLTWFDLTSAAVRTFYGPDWQALAQALAELSAQPAKRAYAPGDLFNDPTAIFCEDWSLPVANYHQLARYFAETAAAAPHLRTSSLGWGVFASCLNWPTRVNNPQHELHVHTTIPLLEINSLHDPATAYAWAVDDAKQLGPRARFVTYLGWGHGAYGHSDCTITTVDNYLIGTTLPPKGTTCAAVPPPDQKTNMTLHAPTATRTILGY